MSSADRYLDRQQELGLVQILSWVPSDAAYEVYKLSDSLRLTHLEALLTDPEGIVLMAERNRIVPGAIKRYDDFVTYDRRYLKGGKKVKEGEEAYKRYKEAHATYVAAMLAATEASSTKRSDATKLAAIAYVEAQRFKAASRSPVLTRTKL